MTREEDRDNSEAYAKAFFAATGQKLVIPPSLHDEMVRRGISTEYVTVQLPMPT